MFRRLIFLGAVLSCFSVSTSIISYGQAGTEGEACAQGVTQRTYTHYSDGSWEWIYYTGGTVSGRQNGNYGHPAHPGEAKHFEDVCRNGHWVRNVKQYY